MAATPSDTKQQEMGSAWGKSGQASEGRGLRWGCLKGRGNRADEGGGGEVVGVLGAVHGVELLAWQFSKLLFTVTRSGWCLLRRDPVRACVCVTET